MKLSSQLKPISYLKAYTAELIRGLEAQEEPIIISQNGEAKAVIQGIKSYEQTQETLTLLKMLALGNQQVEAGQVVSAESAIERLRNKHQHSE